MRNSLRAAGAAAAFAAALTTFPLSAADHFATGPRTATLDCTYMIHVGPLRQADCNAAARVDVPASPLGHYVLTVDWAPTDDAWAELEVHLDGIGDALPGQTDRVAGRSPLAAAIFCSNGVNPAGFRALEIRIEPSGPIGAAIAPPPQGVTWSVSSTC